MNDGLIEIYDIFRSGTGPMQVARRGTLSPKPNTILKPHRRYWQFPLHTIAATFPGASHLYRLFSAPTCTCLAKETQRPSVSVADRLCIH